MDVTRPYPLFAAELAGADLALPRENASMARIEKSIRATGVSIMPGQGRCLHHAAPFGHLAHGRDPRRTTINARSPAALASALAAAVTA